MVLSTIEHAPTHAREQDSYGTRTQSDDKGLAQRQGTPLPEASVDLAHIRRRGAGVQLIRGVITESRPAPALIARAVGGAIAAAIATRIPA